jgi:DNA-binding transcriptional regulator YiaG
MARLEIDPKFIEVHKGKRIVVLDEDEYDRLLDLIDAARARAALADPGDRELDWRDASRGLTGNRIADARSARGLSQRALAARLGVPQSTVSRWEKKDANLTLATVRKIASALDYAVPDLIA